MTIILPGIRSLTDQLRTLHASLEDYRPKQCPACSNRIVWWHGCYSRKADRQDRGVSSLELQTGIPLQCFRNLFWTSLFASKL